MNRDYEYNERGGRMGQGNPQQWEEQSSTRGPNFGQGYGPQGGSRGYEQRGYGEQSYRGREQWGESGRMTGSPGMYGERDFEGQMWRGQGPRDQQGYRTEQDQERQGYRSGPGYDPSRGEPWLRYGRGEEYGSDHGPQGRGYGGYGPQTRGYGGFDRPGFGGKEMEPGGVYGESWGRQGQYGQQGQYGGLYGQQFGGQGRFSGRGPRNYQKSDDRVCEEVCERLTQASEIDASEIDVEVRQGEVYLRGTVEDRLQKRMAEDYAESVSGVKDVRNELRVQSQMQQTAGHTGSYTQETQRATTTAGATGTQGQTRNETPARTR